MKLRFSLEEEEVRELISNKQGNRKRVISEIARQYLMKQIADFAKKIKEEKK